MHCCVFRLAKAAQQLIDKLISRFLAHDIMYALGIVYPQYWKDGDQHASFRKHLDVSKKHFAQLKFVGEGASQKFIPTILDGQLLESQQPLQS